MIYPVSIYPAKLRYLILVSRSARTRQTSVVAFDTFRRTVKVVNFFFFFLLGCSIAARRSWGFLILKILNHGFLPLFHLFDFYYRKFNSERNKKM